MTTTQARNHPRGPVNHEARGRAVPLPGLVVPEHPGHVVGRVIRDDAPSRVRPVLALVPREAPGPGAETWDRAPKPAA